MPVGQRYHKSSHFTWRYLICLVGALLVVTFSYGQLDSIHYIPPLHAANASGAHFLYLSTPETDQFYIQIRLGDGTTARDDSGQLLDQIPISNSSPAVISLGNADIGAMVPTLVSVGQLNANISSKGLIISAGKSFYCNLRIRSGLQAASLTSKGQQAKGTDFRIGHIEGIPLLASTIQRSNVFSVMATEDQTVVRLSDYDTGIEFEAFPTRIRPGPETTFTLQKGESRVFSVYYDRLRPPANSNGLMGARLESNLPVVVNSGSWLGSPYNFNNQDIGIDQIVPVEILNQDYILVRGDGPVDLETPLAIATQDQTEIYINGLPTPFATLDAGEWIRIPESFYTVDQNMYIHGTNPFYVYQMLAGANDGRTGGLNFVPSLGCSDESSIDQIVDVGQIGSTSYEGKLFIVSQTGEELYLNNSLIPANSLASVPGNPHYRTYKVGNLSGSVKVHSTGTVQVGIFGRNQAAGWAGYYSGFKRIELPELTISLNKNCDGSVILDGQTVASDWNWYHNDTLLAFKGDTLFNAPPGRYYVEAIRELCNEIYLDTSAVLVVPRPLSWMTHATPVPCSESKIGSITLDQILGGFPPYRVDISGRDVSSSLRLDSLGPGDYYVVIKDSFGCIFHDTVTVPIVENRPTLALHCPDTITCKDTLAQVFSTSNRTAQKLIYTWTTKDGRILSDTSDATLTVGKAAWYYLSIEDRNTGCFQFDSIWIPEDVSQPEIQIVTGHGINCFTPEVTLRVDYTTTEKSVDIDWLSHGKSVIWDLTDSIRVDRGGKYSVIIENRSNGCIDSAEIVIEEDFEAPELDLLNDTLNCYHRSLRITSILKDSQHILWRWSGSPNGWFSDENSSPLVDEPGVFTAIVQDTLNGCSDTATAVISLDTMPPVAQLHGDSLLTCTDTVLDITARLELECPTCITKWSGSVLQTRSTDSMIIQVVDSGQVVFEVINQQNGCAFQADLNITKAPSLEAAIFDEIQPNCTRRTGEIRIQNVSGGSPPFEYSIDGGLEFSNQKIHTKLSGGLYEVVVRDRYGCEVTETISIMDFEPIALNLLEEEILLELGDSHQVELTLNIPESEVTDILWSTDKGLSCIDCLNPVIFPFESEDYWVKVWDSHGCWDWVRFRIRVDRGVRVFIPNVFTPDDNQVNDGFTIFAQEKGVKGINLLQVYSRWGELMFETQNIPVNRPDLGWRGDFNGVLLKPDVFTYIAEIEFIDGSTQIYAGDVTLLR